MRTYHRIITWFGWPKRVFIGIYLAQVDNGPLVSGSCGHPPFTPRRGRAAHDKILLKCFERIRCKTVARHTSLGTEKDFFKKLREGSRVKRKIVADYFVYYNRVMARRNEKVGYADLFAGPGSYADDGASTNPLQFW